MKILQIATGFDIGYNGGITNYVRSLSESLCQQGHEVVVLDSCKTSNGQYLFKRESLASTVLKPFHSTSVVDNEDVQAMEARLAEISPDIIHVHMMLDLPYKVLEVFQRFAPTILSLHDYSWFCNRILYIRDGVVCSGCKEGQACSRCISSLERYPRFRRYLHKAPLLRHLYQHFPSSGHQERFEYFRKVFSGFSAVLAVSNKVKEIYVRNGVDNPQFFVNHIGNITATDEYRNLFSDKQCHALSGKDVVLGFLGNLSREKGGDLLLSLAKRIPNEIRIYGRLNAPYDKKIRRYKNIRYCGTYKQSDLANCLHGIDLGLVLPIWEDNAPQVVFEFLNSRVPVIGSRMGGIPDFVRPGVNGLLISPDVDGVSDAVSFLNSSDIIETICGMIRNMAGTKTPQVHMTEILNVYEGVLQKRRATAG